MFRYIRYSPRGLLRPARNLDAETPEGAPDVELRKPRRAVRLGTLDPETSEIIWQDQVVDGIATNALLAPAPDNPALL